MLPPLSFFDAGFRSVSGEPEEEKPKRVPGAYNTIEMPEQRVTDTEAGPAAGLTAKKEDVPADPGVEASTVGGETALGERVAQHGAAQEIGAPNVIPPIRGGGQHNVVDGGHYFQPSGGPEVAKDYAQKQYQDLGRAQRDQAGVERLQSDEEAKVLDAQAQELNAKYVANESDREEHRQYAYAQLQQLDQQAQELGKQKIDSGRIFHNPVGILGAIVVSLSAIGSKNPDGAVQTINQAIQRDIDVQQANINTKAGALQQRRGIYAEYLNLMKNDEQARLLSEAQLKRAAAGKMQEIGARYRSPQIEAMARQQSAMLNIMANKDEQNAFLKHWREFNVVPMAIKKARDAYVPPASYQAQGDQMMQQANGMMDTMNAQMAAGPAIDPNAGPTINMPEQTIAGSRPGAVAARVDSMNPSAVSADLPRRERDLQTYYPEAKTYLDAVLTVGSDKKYNVPGLKEELSAYRKDLAYNAAISYLNENQQLYQQDKRKAVLGAVNAAQSAYAKAAATAEEKSSEIDKANTDFVEHTHTVARLDTATNALLRKFGGDVGKVNSFLSIVNGDGIATLGLGQQKLREIAQATGLSSDKDAQEALNYLRDFQQFELQEKQKALRGMRGNAASQAEGQQVYSSFQSFQSLQHRIKVAVENSNALQRTVAGVAGYGPYLIWSAGHRQQVGPLDRKGY